MLALALTLEAFFLNMSATAAADAAGASKWRVLSVAAALAVLLALSAAAGVAKSGRSSRRCSPRARLKSPRARSPGAIFSTSLRPTEQTTGKSINQCLYFSPGRPQPCRPRAQPLDSGRVGVARKPAGTVGRQS